MGGLLNMVLRGFVRGAAERRMRIERGVACAFEGGYDFA
jgi:hypothetical protein